MLAETLPWPTTKHPFTWPDGAEIGAWTSEHLLIGSGVVQKGRALLTIWGDDIMTPKVDGAVDGETILLTCWRVDQNKECPLAGTNWKNALMPTVMSTSLQYHSNSVWLIEIDAATNLPTEFGLSQNYPNPFNANTTIKYQLPHDTHVEMVVYNLSGAKVQTLIYAVKKAGYHEIIWNGQDSWHRPVSSGIYWIQMKAGDYHKVFKMSLIK